MVSRSLQPPIFRSEFCLADVVIARLQLKYNIHNKKSYNEKGQELMVMIYYEIFSSHSKPVSENDEAFIG